MKISWRKICYVSQLKWSLVSLKEKFMELQIEIGTMKKRRKIRRKIERTVFVKCSN